MKMANNISTILEKKEISILKLSQGIEMTYAATHALVKREDLSTTQFENIKKIAEFLEVEISELYEDKE